MISMSRYRVALPSFAFALIVGAFTLLMVLGGSRAVGPQIASAQGEGRYNVLAYSRTTIAGSHTQAIEDGHEALDDLAAAQDFDITHSDDAGMFSDHSLRQFDVVVFLNSNGEGNLNARQRVAFERWTQRGGGAVRIHADGNADKAWDWKRDMMGGGLFNNHPPIQEATVEVADPNHPATDDLPASITWSDEWYNFDEDPREDVHVLLTVDESTYDPGPNGHGPGHPIAWCSEYDGGRNFYTAIGHGADGASLVWEDQRYLDHISGALEWAAGEEPGDCGEPRDGIPTEASLTKETLVGPGEVANPMSLDIANDGRVFFTQMGSTMAPSGPANVRMHDPEAGETYDIATLQVLRRNENGLMGIALDPDFDSNNFIYVYYSVPGPFNEMGTHNLSRFTFDPEAGEAGELDMSSEVVLLEVPHQRQVCCHASGSVQFGPDDLLYLSTGDDTEHARSGGYSPHDARPCGPGSWNPGDANCQSGQQDTWATDARHANDARRSSGDTADLRGKILRIDPIDSATPSDEPGVGSTYEVPDDNLFTSGEFDHLFPGGTYDPELGYPEIYTMGHRNPFRFGFDEETGWIYQGEVGPDSNSDSLSPPPSTDRGPRGYDEVNQIREAGNFGWPYCIADNKAYRPYIFTGTGNSGAGVPGDNNPDWPDNGSPGPQDNDIPYFDCEGGPFNHSPLNDGLETVPPTEEAWIYYPYGSSPDFPDIPAAGSRAAIGGPVYRYDPELDSDVKLSEWFDGKLIWGDWTRNIIMLTDIDESGGYAGSTELMPNELFRHPHDIELGPDGALYIIEWGLNFNYGSYNINPDAGIYRISQRTGGLPAEATATATPGTGVAPLEVEFTGELSDRGADDPPTYEWDFGDGETSTEVNPTHTYDEPGTYEATLTVTDSDGVTTDTVTIQVIDTACPFSDEFDGEVLEPCRWTQIVRENPDDYSVGGGLLSIVAGPGDMFGGVTNAENLITQPVASPDGEWSVETEVSYEATENYHQAGLILYGDDLNWAKFGLLWADGRVLEYIWQQNGTPRRDTSQDVMPVDEGFPSTFLMRLESDGTDVTAHYSIDDGETWTQVGRTVPIATIPDPHVGLFAFRATTGSTENEATFDYFRVTPDVDPGEDMTPPETTVSLDPAEPGAGGTYEEPVTVTLDAEDPGENPSGVDFTEYSLDGSDNWVTYTEPFTLSDPEAYAIQFRSQDLAGNLEDAKSVEFSITEPGEPALSLKVKPTRKSARVGRAAKFTAQVTNTGNAAASKLRICAKAPKRKVKVVGKGCARSGELAADERMSPKFKLRPKAKARGKRVKVKFTATAAGLDTERATATLKVKR